MGKCLPLAAVLGAVTLIGCSQKPNYDAVGWDAIQSSRLIADNQFDYTLIKKGNNWQVQRVPMGTTNYNYVPTVTNLNSSQSQVVSQNLKALWTTKDGAKEEDLIRRESYQTSRVEGTFTRL